MIRYQGIEFSSASELYEYQQLQAKNGSASKPVQRTKKKLSTKGQLRNSGPFPFKRTIQVRDSENAQWVDAFSSPVRRIDKSLLDTIDRDEAVAGSYGDRSMGRGAKLIADKYRRGLMRAIYRDRETGKVVGEAY